VRTPEGLDCLCISYGPSHG